MYLSLKKTKNTPAILQEFDKREINAVITEYKDSVDIDIHKDEMERNGYLAFASITYQYVKIHKTYPYDAKDEITIPFEEILVIYNI